MITKQDNEFWKRKLMAYLHDPPCKPLDIRNHEEVAETFMRSAGFDDADIARLKLHKDADHTASAIDRLPFAQRKCSAQFTGNEGESFKHPFSSDTSYTFANSENIGAYIEVLQNAFGGIEGTWKDKFFLYWRRWLENSVSGSESYASNLAIFPADTRIPDHTIWSHMAVTSALEGCREATGKIKPAFLMFQAGPVQEFIAQARSTRDLWSGSYMLSWLTGSALKAITDATGPDAIIFPALRGNGIFDILNKDIYDEISYDGKNNKSETLWQRLYDDGSTEHKLAGAEVLLNPALPNRFFAVVPADRAEELAQRAEKAFKTALVAIAEHCWERFYKFAKGLDESLKVKSWKERWDKQIELLPEITWQVMPVEDDIDKIRERAAKLPAMQGENSSLKTLNELLKLATATMPFEDRDGRYYKDKAKTQLSNWGITWAINYAMCDYALAARRNTRDFIAFNTDEQQAGASKDMLSGREEIIGTPEFWELVKANSEYFKDNEGPYGAISIIKRFWCRGDKNYLLEKLNINKAIFNQVIGADSVTEIAEQNILTAQEKANGCHKSSNPYVAIIALDGDSMGQWMSGEKAPSLLGQLSGKAPAYFKGLGITDNLKRPLTPSYHLQFSEALANFANHLAGQIVKDCDGQLIYAGGDDLLAMVPATKAVKCAQLLRIAFRGDKNYVENMADYNKMKFSIPNNGFVNSSKDYPLIVPGIAADVSCGIAIAHSRYPLQRMVKEAQYAEQRAKHTYNRGAFAVSLLKRGGEIVHWGSKWDSGALELYYRYIQLRQADKISARFPYALAGLLAPHELEQEDYCDGLDIEKLIKTELSYVLEQQIGKQVVRDELNQLCQPYLMALAKGISDDRVRWSDFTKLFLTAAFIERDRGE
jgi:CRISPR-associated protein Cmr2